METKLINQVNEAIPIVVKSTVGILPAIKDSLLPLIPLIIYSPVLIIPVIAVIYRVEIWGTFQYLTRQNPMPPEVPIFPAAPELPEIPEILVIPEIPATPPVSYMINSMMSPEADSELKAHIINGDMSIAIIN